METDQLRVLLTVGRWRMSVRLLPGLEEYFEDTDLLLLLSGKKFLKTNTKVLRTSLFNRYSYENENLFQLLHRFRGFIVVRNTITGRTMATARDNRIISLDDVTQVLIVEMITAMEQSGGDMPIQNIELTFVYFQRVEGAGKVHIPKYPVSKPTWQQHFFNGRPVNCAAFCIAYHMNEKNKVLKRIIIKAVTLQQELEWDTFVKLEDFQKFIEVYPEYRLTVLLPNIINHKATTYTGSEYNLEFESNNRLTRNCKRKTIYLTWDAVSKHYGLADPTARYRYEKNTANYIFCHSCLTIKQGF